MELEFSSLLRLARRWWWLLLLLPAVAGTASYMTASRQVPLYSATATLLINAGSQSGGGNEYQAILGSQSLTETYRQLVSTRPVIEPVIDDLALPYTVDELQGMVSATTELETQLIELSVSDTDPNRAASVANAIATNFSTYISRQAAALGGPARQVVEQQLTETQLQIDQGTDELEALESGVSAADPAAQTRRDSLRARITELREYAAELLLTAQRMDLNTAGAQAQVTVAVPASVPSAPYAPQTQLYTLIGAFAGLALAVGTVALLGYLDNTVKADSDITALTGGPLLSTVPRLSNLRGGHSQLFVLDHPTAPAAETIRLLRVNLEFAAAAQSIKTLAITSAGPGEGKSTITANLGVALAQAGLSTVIIDADLRRPSQHRIFELQSNRGLSWVLAHTDQPWRSAAVEVGIPDLLLIPSGPLPPNPADLLTLDRFQQILAQISAEFDIVLIDTPPVLAVSDPLVVASKVDAVTLVCHAGRTRVDALRRSAAALQQGGARLIGVVINRETARSGAGYYYYGKYDSDPSAALPSRARVRSARVGD